MIRSGFQADACDGEVICPKPRKLALSFCPAELIKPMCQWQSSPRTPECEAGYEILQIFLNKDTQVDCESPKFGSSPPYWSPPSRAGNPIVHDVHFHQQMASPPATSFPKPKAFSGPSFSASPSLRVEGFDCARRDARRDVPAVA